MNIEKFFLDLIKYTYIYGYEEVFESVLPQGTKKDEFELLLLCTGS